MVRLEFLHVNVDFQEDYWGVTRCYLPPDSTGQSRSEAIPEDVDLFRRRGNWPRGFMERTICTHRDSLEVVAIHLC